MGDGHLESAVAAQHCGGDFHFGGIQQVSVGYLECGQFEASAAHRFTAMDVIPPELQDSAAAVVSEQDLGHALDMGFVGKERPAFSAAVFDGHLAGGAAGGWIPP